MQLEAALRERPAQVELQRTARLRAGVHLGLEEAESAAPIGLGPIHRQIGALQKIVRVEMDSVGAEDGDADAGADEDLMLVDDARRLDGVDQAAGQHARSAREFRRKLQNGEFVAAEPGDLVRVPDGALQTAGDAFQKLVPDRMTERVVDVLEAVEVEKVDGEVFPAPASPDERFLQLLAEEDPVGQAGEGVMMRLVANGRFRAFPVDDLYLELLVRLAKLLGALGDAPLQVLVGLAEGAVGALHRFLGMFARHLRFGARQRDGEVDGLRHVVVRAELERLHDVVVLRERRDHDHGERSRSMLLPDARQHLKAVDARHHHIQQHEIKGLLGDELEGAEAVAGFDDLVAPPLKASRQNGAIFGHVIDDQESRGCRRDRKLAVVRCSRHDEELRCGQPMRRSRQGADVVTAVEHCARKY